MKRIFTFFFALLSACTFSAYAAIVDGTCGDNLTWTLNSKDSTLVIAGTGEMTDDDYFSAPWYDYRSYIKYVTLPDGLTSIGYQAFYDCKSLTSVTIPNSVTNIETRAFASCDGLTSITIPNSVTSIGDYAFASCYGLTSITIGNSVTSIGEGAFQNCSGLTSVTIGNSVTSIGSYAFRYCYGLTSVTIGNSVTNIETRAFASCDGLTSVVWNAKNCADFSNNYAPFKSSKITSFTIGDSVQHIPAYLCYGMSGLTSITIPNSVTSIGTRAFRDCSSLTSVTIGNSVTSIGEWAFWGCTSLTSVTIGNSVTSIGSYAFRDCSKLTSIIIPNSVTSIGNAAFSWCESLTSITIPNSVTRIGGGVFVNCTSLTSVVLSENMTSLSNTEDEEWLGFFQGCSSLTSITIPNSVTSIGNYAFEGCSRLTSITLGNSVTSIRGYAFRDCNQIQEVTAYMPTPPVATSCGINPAAATLYVPAEYIDAYSNTIWWEDFKEIRALDADYVVTFLDWDGTTLATAGVAAGQAATAPEAPVREGYTFIGWDKDFSCVIEDMTITAQYQINRYGVRFYDWDNTLLKTDSVDYQSAATAPADPTREGYTFLGWDKDFSSITADLDVHAQYEAGADKEFEVIFSDQDNNELSAQSVTLRVPLAPEIEGFTFLYWKTIDARVDDVITIQAVYVSDSPTAAPEVYVNPANPAQKLIRNGQVYILHEDKMYTISGQVVK